MEVIILPDAGAAADAVARIVAETLRSKPRVVLGLATGRTMEAVYARLVRIHREEGLDFSGCTTFNLDEYIGLPGNHPNSYRYYMNQNLFLHVNIDLKNTHVPNGVAANLNAECENYERLITSSGGIDLQLLGLGLSGHLGFNEPPSAFDSRTRCEDLSPITIAQNASHFPKPELVPRRAITMGMGTVLESRHCVLLATGAEKAGITAKAVDGPISTKLPASALRSHPASTMVLDEAAASQLEEPHAFRNGASRKFVQPVSASK